MSEPKTTLSHAEFSMLAARIAQIASGWAADALSLPEDAARVVEPATAATFADEIKTRLNRILERAGKPE